MDRWLKAVSYDHADLIILKYMPDLWTYALPHVLVPKQILQPFNFAIALKSLVASSFKHAAFKTERRR